MSSKDDSGLGNFLAFIGFFVGIGLFGETDPGTAFIAGIVLMVVGYVVGRIVDWVFGLAVAICCFLAVIAINTAVRQFLFNVIAGG